MTTSKKLRWAFLSKVFVRRSSLAKTAPIALAIPIGVLAAAAPAWLLSHSERHWQAGAGIFLLAVIIGVVVLDVLHGRFHAANIKYFALFSYAVFLGVGMLLDLRDEAYTFDGRGIVLTLGALFCFLFGFARKSHALEAKRSENANAWVDSKQLFVISVLFYLLGFGALIAEWHFCGQLQTYSGRLVSETGEVTPVPPSLYAWPQLIGPGSIMALVVLRRGSPWFKTFTLSIFLLFTIIWYALAGVRSNFLALAIAWLLVWLEVPNKQGSKKIGSIPIIVSCIAFASMLTLSVVRTDWDFSRAQAEGLSGMEQPVGESLNIFRELCKTVEYFPAHNEYLYGYSFYGVVTNIVPRVWWPDKPVGVGKLASIIFDQNPESSIALSLPGELYANFGMFGSLLGMVLFGLSLNLIYHWYLRRQGNQGALVIYVFLVVTATQEVRGDILDATVPLIYYLLPVILSFYVVASFKGFRTRRSRAKRHFRSSNYVPLQVGR